MVNGTQIYAYHYFLKSKFVDVDSQVIFITAIMVR